jgi:hypothetical protein
MTQVQADATHLTTPKADETMPDHQVVDHKPTDSTIVDPAVHQVILENEHVRVINARAAHGWKSAMHSHPPMLVIVLGSGRQKVTWPDGSTQIVDLNPGTVVWQDNAFDHSWELLAGEVDVMLVEVKSAKPTP